jgi:hypothetical protein
MVVLGMVVLGMVVLGMVVLGTVGYVSKSSEIKYLKPQMGIGIRKTNAGIGIPVSNIPVPYRSKKRRTASL